MPKDLVKRWHGMHNVWAFVLIFALTIALASYRWTLGLAALALSGVLAVYTIMAERAFRKDLNEYVLTLTYRMKSAGADVIGHLPFGIVLYNEDKVVEWHNPYFSKIIGRPSAVGEPLKELLPALHPFPKDKENGATVETAVDDRIYSIQIKPKEKLLYVHDITEMATLRQRYEEEKLALGIVMMDNLEEVTQGMDEQQRAIMLSKVTGEINEWAQSYGLLLRRMAADRYMVITNQATLKALEQSRFDLLDQVREITMDLKLPMTLSIGFATGSDDIVELGEWAQSSLDMALGRGGDQAVVRAGERQSFYGGKSNAVEKRTRVRARVIAHALRDLMKESENVIIMGHKMPDMDSMGAAVGLLKAAQLHDVEAYIVLEERAPAIQRLLDLLKEDEKLAKRMITPEQALSISGPRTLAIVVDTHRATMVAEPRLLQQAGRIVIIDHHRRSEEFIDDAVLIFMEPYASSTCELVTELLQYIHERVTLDVREATALLAGITVDTKSFSQRTGARTHEAASFLRRNGADPALIQRMLQDSLQEYIRKSEIIRNAEMFGEHIVIAASASGEPVQQLLIAQAADTLLNMAGVQASFVVGKRPDGMIGISARSQGQINVQVIMEKMGGGGHLTNAAAQVQGSVSEAVSRLKAILKEIEQEEGMAQ